MRAMATITTKDKAVGPHRLPSIMGSAGKALWKPMRQTFLFILSSSIGFVAAGIHLGGGVGGALRSEDHLRYLRHNAHASSAS
jgi:hypothetical protein